MKSIYIIMFSKSGTQRADRSSKECEVKKKPNSFIEHETTKVDVAVYLKPKTLEESKEINMDGLGAQRMDTNE